MRSQDHLESVKLFGKNIFGRRKTSRENGLGDGAATGRQLQISGPYNFRHLNHTKHEHPLNLPRSSYVDLITEFSAICADQRPTTAGHLGGIDVEDTCLAKLSWPLRSSIHEEPVEPTLPVSSAPSPRSSSLVTTPFIISSDSVVTSDSTLEHPQTSSGVKIPSCFSLTMEAAE
ncbi:hypothetical protein CGRA01v4_10706 [Colletotrichum graminicola]|uniref:CRIB domain-containing protein n=1 Tax=Colletotrichum graminicola (strain M1.001 / M2 / FGSC 10212) TaxID=645133 RepID=E3R144_COLGM|nr:uncharacterized protein GLRG_11976 [Colletotrichum graminicola M1.001]EFQ36832.1 hypothetical protein GLRG_11976 [Colletotrichum graminicola M1.001]WDK19419.1 hypothetical protein CGRA01v4_10706 [Colletotrichum graminicola]